MEVRSQQTCSMPSYLHASHTAWRLEGIYKEYESGDSCKLNLKYEKNFPHKL